MVKIKSIYNKNLCICLGYESLVVALHLINNGEDVIVYTNRKDIIKFCKSINLPIVEGPSISLSEVVRFNKIIKEKIITSLNNLNVRKYNIHITHKNFDLHSLAIAMFGKYNIVFFHRTEIDVEKEYSRSLWPAKSIKKNVKYLLYYWLWYRFLIYKNYRISLTYRYLLGQLVPVVKLGWLKKKTRIIEYDNIQRFFYETYRQTKVDIEECENLFLFTDIKELSHYIKRDSLVKIHDYLLRQGVYIKGHPNRNFKSDYPLQYPPFLPAELIIPKITNSIIAVSSFSFRYSLKYENIKSISLFEIVEWTDNAQKSMTKNYLDSFGGNLIYPTTLEELGKLLRTK